MAAPSGNSLGFVPAEMPCPAAFSAHRGGGRILVTLKLAEEPGSRRCSFLREDRAHP
jgi:hypothetical protein